MPTRKSSTARTLGVHVELACGETVLVRPWGWDHLAQNTAVISDIVVDAFNAIGGTGDDDATASAVRDAITRNLAKFRQLLAASLEGGDADVDKMAGFGDLVNVIDAVIETNDLFGALAKGRARYRAIQEAMQPEAPQS